MHRYETMGVLGEGAYGIVMKCKHKETGQLVAVKKFMEPEEDPSVKKIALREVKMLKLLRHENLICLLEVFKKKKHYYLVFEYVDHTVLDELEGSPNGLDEYTGKGIIWQVTQGIRFCHLNGVVHRDVKPENVLISERGVVKLCDFGFARRMAAPGEAYTDYVATRWYRAPELLVGDNMYNESVDVWSIGCLLVELLTGEPLFPGDSDIDQIYHITKCLGNLITYHRELFNTNSLFRGVKLPLVRRVVPIQQRFPQIPAAAAGFIQTCLILDPRRRPGSEAIISHAYFNQDEFGNTFVPHLATQVRLEYKENILLQRLGVIVYGSGFRHFPPTPIPEEIKTPDLTASPLPKKEAASGVNKRKLKRSSQLVTDAQPPLEINHIEKVLLELQAESSLCRELDPSVPNTHDPLRIPSRTDLRTDLVRIPSDPFQTLTAPGLGGKEAKHPFAKQHDPHTLVSTTRSPARRHTPEKLPPETFNSPKRVTDSRQAKPYPPHELPLTPQQASQKRKQASSTAATSFPNKTAASFLPNLMPKEKSAFKSSHLRTLPNPDTITSSRKWNEKIHTSLSKLDQPKLSTNIPQLTPLDISYISRNDSDESFIV